MRNKKTVLIISPQLWGKVFVSKHHYAVELERMGYKVFFVNPPQTDSLTKVNISTPYPGKDIHLVDSGFPNYLFLRYNVRPVYSLLVNRWLKAILRSIPHVDIAWCFETNIFQDFRLFADSKKILHIVDPVDKRVLNAAKTADLIVCVSDRIMAQFNGIQVQKQFVNHGLSAVTIRKAAAISFETNNRTAKPKVGYIGNLSRAIIDVEVIYSLVDLYPGIEFHFWGPGKNSNLGGESELLSQKLQQKKNVYFHSEIPSDELIEAVAAMDAFILAYKYIEGVYDSSNSHKILEYFATGKVVISTYIDQYKDAFFAEYICMSKEGENDEFPVLFERVIADLEQWNSPEKIEKRRSYAFAHSYLSNARKILALVNE